MKNLIGMRFGKLTVESDSGRDKHKNVVWLCLCDCGNTTTVLSGNLRSGAVRSCGCIRSEVHTERGRLKRQQSAPSGHKKCSSCQQILPVEVFYSSKSTSDGLDFRCKECAKHSRREARLRKLQIDPDYYNRYARGWRVKNPDASKTIRNRGQKKYRYTQYGLTEEVFNTILESQGGVCDICHMTPADGVWHVDHDSKFGKIEGRRSILCRGCNTGIGVFKHNPQILENAITYLDRWAEELFYRIENLTADQAE